MELESFLTNKNNISTWCYSDPLNSLWILSCIYGPLEKINKPAFWDFLTVVGEDFVNPWLCIGDLIFFLIKRKSLEANLLQAPPTILSETLLIILVWLTLVLLETPSLGFATIKERLDRGLASLDWVHLHAALSLLHLPASISNHNPISLNTNTTSSYLPKPYKFEEFWTLDPTYGLVIAAAWNHFVVGSLVVCLVKKLDQTKATLKRRNNIHFGNIQDKIKSSLFKID